MNALKVLLFATCSLLTISCSSIQRADQYESFRKLAGVTAYLRYDANLCRNEAFNRTRPYEVDTSGAYRPLFKLKAGYPFVIEDFIVKKIPGSVNVYVRTTIRHKTGDYPAERDLYFYESPSNPAAVAQEVSKPVNRFWTLQKPR